VQERVTKFSCAWLKNDGIRATGVVRRRWDVWLSRAAKNGKVYVLYVSKNLRSTNINLLSKIKGYATNSCDFFKVNVFLLAAAIMITRHGSQKPAYATDQNDLCLIRPQ
jgi:hypothetical protein